MGKHGGLPALDNRTQLVRQIKEHEVTCITCLQKSEGHIRSAQLYSFGKETHISVDVITGRTDTHGRHIHARIPLCRT